ncbi:MAG: hypothetical protein AAGA80_18925 [Cyanobacteria bacterium P01_F01_bin.143]
MTLSFTLLSQANLAAITLVFNQDMWEEWTADEMRKVNITYELKSLSSIATAR